MKILNYNQIKIFINLEIIREEDKNKKKIIYISIFLKSKKNSVLVQSQFLNPTFII